MGKKLADELARGSGRLLTTSKPVTLGAEELQELNDRIKDPKRPNAIPLNLLSLRQIEFSRERQRIKNIKVAEARCQKLGPQLPDQIIFKFILDGKSIVRARNRLFAFDPEVKRGSDEVALAGLTFETDGGRHGSAGWTDATGGSPGSVLKGEALWQPDVTSQENLLTDLMKDYNDTTAATQLITIAQFRPGVFSDFVLTVEFSPPERKVKFTELALEFSLETGDANVRSVFVSVNNNRGLDIPITASTKDQSGREGGTGTYVGLYPDVRNLTEEPIRFSVPATYGRYRHVGWLVDGSAVQDRANTISVSTSSYLTALYQE